MVRVDPETLMAWVAPETLIIRVDHDPVVPGLCEEIRRHRETDF